MHANSVKEVVMQVSMYTNRHFVIRLSASRQRELAMGGSKGMNCVVVVRAFTAQLGGGVI
jgi:hypothetical protein